MKHLLILVMIAFLASFCGLISVTNGQSKSPKENRPRLTVELSAVKAVYRPKEDISLKVMVTNDALLDDVFVYGELGFGYAASFTLFRRDAKGREVPTRFT